MSLIDLDRLDDGHEHMPLRGQMTKWIEDISLEAPEGHRWMKPAPEDCPNCPCHTLRVCEGGLWAQAQIPTYPDGRPYTERCSCEAMATAQHVLRDALKEMHETAGPAPECCGHITCRGDDPCGYIVMGMITESVRCGCTGTPT